MSVCVGDLTRCLDLGGFRQSNPAVILRNPLFLYCSKTLVMTDPFVRTDMLSSSVIIRGVSSLYKKQLYWHPALHRKLHTR